GGNGVAVIPNWIECGNPLQVTQIRGRPAALRCTQESDGQPSSPMFCAAMKKKMTLSSSASGLLGFMAQEVFTKPFFWNSCVLNFALFSDIHHKEKISVPYNVDRQLALFVLSPFSRICTYVILPLFNFFYLPYYEMTSRLVIYMLYLTKEKIVLFAF
ncbi:unnamed protein product, partial [Urochloa humidicola]